MKETVPVRCVNTNEVKEVAIGTQLKDLIDFFGAQSKYLIGNAKVNNKTESLNYRVYRPRKVEFVDISRPSAMRTYVRSLCFVLAKAVHDVLPNSQVYFEHAVSRGYYFTVENGAHVGKEELHLIKQRMHEIIQLDLPFQQIEEEKEVLVQLFNENNMQDKASLIETSDDLIYARYSQLDNYIDYYYGCLLPSTRYLSIFDIVQCNGDFLLVIPDRNDPVKLETVIDQPKLLQVYRKHQEFLSVSKLNTVGELNNAIRSNKISEIIQISEAYQTNEIINVANEITRKYDDGLRVVLISGPSSSGKTTFRKRLEVQLYVNMLKPVGISLDDYFVNRDDTPLDDSGEKDYESLYAIDLDLFSEHLEKLLNNEEISLPTYNFVTGKREYRGQKLKMDNKSVLIIEGIHALNPELTQKVGDHKKYMVYVSALTSISLDNHNWIPASDNRLLRRMIRDHRYRGYSAADTISRWNSVRRGEDKWIFPFQENADALINTAMIYELAAIRRHAEPVLRRVPKSAPEYAEAYRLLKFLSYFNYITDRELPPTSLLREFLGGSSFRY